MYFRFHYFIENLPVPSNLKQHTLFVLFYTSFQWTTKSFSYTRLCNRNKSNRIKSITSIENIAFAIKIKKKLVEITKRNDNIVVSPLNVLYNYTAFLVRWGYQNISLLCFLFFNLMRFLIKNQQCYLIQWAEQYDFCSQTRGIKQTMEIFEGDLMVRILSSFESKWQKT